MTTQSQDNVYDYVVIGSGFGGSVSAMRLSEKGYRVLVLERGKRFADLDFPKSNWAFWKYLWAPAIGCFGILQVSFFKDVFVLHGSGVGGGSLGYANVLMQPDDKLFENPAWKDFADWKTILQPYYQVARNMLGVTKNTRFWKSDEVLREIAFDLGAADSYQSCDVGVFFGSEPDGKPGVNYSDPYFKGLGPDRTSCDHCGACLVGCRKNAKNTLEKNYLFFAEKFGAVIESDRFVTDIQPIQQQTDDTEHANYRVLHKNTTSSIFNRETVILAKNVVVSAGTLGTLNLLFRCRDITKSLPGLSPALGEKVRTNCESLLGSVAHGTDVDYSQGISITTIFQPDGVTAVEPVRYPSGSSLMRFLSSPLIEGKNILTRLLRTLAYSVLHPINFLKIFILEGWSRNTTILLVMQTMDSQIKLKLGRSIFTMFRKGLVSDAGEDGVQGVSQIGGQVTRMFSERIHGIPCGSVNESLFDTPMTAHLLGGVPISKDVSKGVIDLECKVHNYPGLFIVDGSIVPANPGVNPSLTITALAEYAMDKIAPKPGHALESKIGFDG